MQNISQVFFAVLFLGFIAAIPTTPYARIGLQTDWQQSPPSEKLLGKSANAPSGSMVAVNNGRRDPTGNTFASKMGIQFKDGDHVRTDLAKEAGFGVIRKGLYWSRVEKTKGQYDFRWFDEIVEDARTRNIVISATLYGNNPLYGYNKDDGVAIVSEAGRRGFARFAAEAAAQYADAPVVFEIWNEPNLRSFWRAHPENPDKSNIDAMADEYTLLVRETVPAMKAVNPNLFISAGSISALWRDSFSWFDRTIKQGLLDSGIDALSVHPYGFRWPELAERKGYSVVRSMLADAGYADMPIVNTEVGFPAGDWITDRGYSAEEAVLLQGALLIRQQLLDLLYGLEYSIWYEFRSSDSYGILDRDFNKRPAFTAAKIMYAELNGFRLVKRLKTRRREDFLLLFTNDTTDKIVAWTSPRGQKRVVPHGIVLDYDIQGIRDTFGLSVAPNGKMLLLSEYPQFVTIAR